jgi:hypothetical protein
MMKKMFLRAVRLARGAALFWGATLTVAAVLGVVTTALAALPGDPLRLGQLNVIDGAATILTGNNPSSTTLEVANTATDPSARALRLKVDPGNAPLVVEPSAGTASNLSADKLDGKDSITFANGTNGKADNADRLDGKDSTAFWSGKSYQVERAASGIGGGDVIPVGANCDPGDKVINVGGGPLGDIQDDLIRIEVDGDSRGLATILDNGAGGVNNVFVQVLCADFPPLRP